MHTPTAILIRDTHNLNENTKEVFKNEFYKTFKPIGKIDMEVNQYGYVLRRESGRIIGKMYLPIYQEYKNECINPLNINDTDIFDMLNIPYCDVLYDRKKVWFQNI